MALMASIPWVFFSWLCFSLAAPVHELLVPLGSPLERVSELPVYVRQQAVLTEEPTLSPLLPLPYSEPTKSLFSPTVTASNATRASLLPSSDLTTTTVPISKNVPETITITGAPVTTIDSETFIAPSTRTQSPATRSTQTLTSSRGLGPAKTIWVTPASFTDLSSFQVSKLAGGESNMRFVADVPLQSQAKLLSNSHANSQETSSSDDHQSTDSSVIQLLFPAGSIDPGQIEKPHGGTQFYASPIELSNSKNVTLEYSVFFPEDFDWVLGGKLPGLYGGHTGCSGGNTATDCFSTRLMWRESGAGELYLYAPKDKQTSSFCNTEGSACNEEYGLSLGRGSFIWKLGSWTTIRQTVVLNTPGKQNGVFKLEVNDKTRIHRDDIFYREDISSEKATKIQKNNTHTKGTNQATSSKRPPARPTNIPSSSDGGGLLGPLLGGLLGSLGLRDEMVDKIAVSTMRRRVASIERPSSMDSSAPTVLQTPDPILGFIDAKHRRSRPKKIITTGKRSSSSGYSSDFAVALTIRSSDIKFRWS